MDMNYDPLFPLADPQERVPERMTNRSRPQISITDRDLGMDESAEMPEMMVKSVCSATAEASPSSASASRQATRVLRIRFMM